MTTPPNQGGRPPVGPRVGDVRIHQADADLFTDAAARFPSKAAAARHLIHEALRLDVADIRRLLHLWLRYADDVVELGAAADPTLVGETEAALERLERT